MNTTRTGKIYADVLLREKGMVNTSINYKLTIENRINRWNQIYSEQGKRWGTIPSFTAICALPDIYKATVGTGNLIDIGGGYGRDALYFKSIFPALTVDILDASGISTNTVKQDMLLGGIRNALGINIFDLLAINREVYDVVFANYFIHLFFDDEIINIFKIIQAILKRDGLIILSLVSTKDTHYKKRGRIANKTYETIDGIPWRFFDDTDIREIIDCSNLRIENMFHYSELEFINGKPDIVEGIYLLIKNEID